MTKRMMDLDGLIKPIKAIVDKILGKDEDEENKKNYARG